MDDDVGKCLSDLTNHKLRIEARLKQSNEVSANISINRYCTV